MDIDDDPEAFVVRGLWRQSRFALHELHEASTLFPHLELDINSIRLDNPYAPSKTLEDDLRLPHLETFRYGPLEDLDSLHESVISSVAIQQPPEGEGQDDDVWEIATDLGPTHEDIKFHTWESFERPAFVEPNHAYIAEAGRVAFDAALARNEKGKDARPSGSVIRSDVFMGSLFNLGLGRSSALFRYDHARNTFAQAISDGRMSGFSLQSAQNLIDNFMHGGSAFRYLMDFAKGTYGSGNAFPARVALANAVGTIISAMENHLGNQRCSVESLLQLQNLFERPHRILAVVRETVDTVKPTRSNEEMISRLYMRVQDMEQEDVWLRSVLLEILKKVSEPWLEFAADWTGLRHDFGSRSSKGETQHTFVGIEESSEDHTESPAIVEHMYKSEQMPSFISEEDGRLIFETGKSLRFLESHHADHPLCSPRSVGVRAPQLDWRFDWGDMESIATKAKEYEKTLADAIRKYRVIHKAHDASDWPSVDKRTYPDTPALPDYARTIQETMDVFEQVPQSEESGLATNLHHLVLACISNRSLQSGDAYTFAPPLSLTSSLSLTPLFLAQARLVNAITLRLFFRSHRLRLHISLQRQYQFLGDGVFVSRLTSALFSPELETAERRRGTVRTGAPMGLKLGSRSAWPPASSELRLALMGVLSESYHTSTLYHSTKQTQTGAKPVQDRMLRETPDLPGNLSFAVRILSNDEIEKCMDPDSLYALDFLRLQYTPPPPLHLIMTPAALEKYDDCFKLLLRIARMLFVVSHQIPRHGLPGVWESKSFRSEAQHFVSCVSAYFFDTGIGETWDAFEASLDSLEQRMQREDDAEELGSLVTEGLESVRAAHEACLERVLFALLLKRRQAQVMQLLEEIFEAILAFAKIAAAAPTDGDGDGDGDGAVDMSVEDANKVRELHMRFRSKINVFMTVCRGLSGKRGYAKGQAALSSLFGEKGVVATTTDDNTIDRLLLMLEMSGYYAAPVATDLGKL